LNTHAQKRGHEQMYQTGSGGFADQMADPYGDFFSLHLFFKKILMII